MAIAEKDYTKLWDNYFKQGSPDNKRDLMLSYIWLVKYVLQSMSLPTNSILNYDDFVNIGILGLNEAIERYNTERGVKFESYAIPRIKGIILDELRKLDWLSRTARKKAHELMQASDALKMEKGGEVSSEDIRKRLNVSHEEYQSYLKAAAAAKASLSLIENSQASMSDEDRDLLEEIPDYNQESIMEVMENEERLQIITSFLTALNERKRLVMTLYYYESLTFKEIGEILSISESRVCQIHGQVVGDLRIKINEMENA
jgi:RNA polymerase sigma factor for flagellar operon FliA